MAECCFVHESDCKLLDARARLVASADERAFKKGVGPWPL